MPAGSNSTVEVEVSWRVANARFWKRAAVRHPGMRTGELGEPLPADVEPRRNVAQSPLRRAKHGEVGQLDSIRSRGPACDAEVRRRGETPERAEIDASSFSTVAITSPARQAA